MSVEISGDLLIGPQTEAQQQLNNFWPKIKDDVLNMTIVSTINFILFIFI